MTSKCAASVASWWSEDHQLPCPLSSRPPGGAAAAAGIRLTARARRGRSWYPAPGQHKALKLLLLLVNDYCVAWLLLSYNRAVS
jgi:hypothetical protein